MLVTAYLHPSPRRLLGTSSEIPLHCPDLLLLYPSALVGPSSPVFCSADLNIPFNLFYSLGVPSCSPVAFVMTLPCICLLLSSVFLGLSNYLFATV